MRHCICDYYILKSVKEKKFEKWIDKREEEDLHSLEVKLEENDENDPN